MKKSQLVATVLVGVTLAGCSPTAALRRLQVGPNYERRATELPERFRGQPDPSDPASVAELPWWEVASGYFQLLELDRRREIARSSAETYQRMLDLIVLSGSIGPLVPAIRGDRLWVAIEGIGECAVVFG